MDAHARVTERLRLANTRGEPLTIVGHGSRRLRPVDPSRKLSSDGLDRVIEVDADERVATVESGVSLGDWQQSLAREGLIFPPTFPAALLESSGFEGANRGTLGGLLSDPRELPVFPHRGRVRDHVLGIEAIRGDGTRFKAGGRVVKNVTGYDLTRLLCGARGRLGLITQAHLRLDRLPESVVASRLTYPDDDALFFALANLRASGREPLLTLVQPGPPHRLLLVEAGPTEVASLQLGRLLEIATREPIEPWLELPGLDVATGRARDRLEGLWSSVPPVDETTLRVRVRLPFRRWPSFIRTLPLTRLPIAWENIAPFAHFGIARVTAPFAPAKREALDALRRVTKEHGGNATLESLPAEWPANDDPLREESSTSTWLLREVTRAWDPSHVLSDHDLRRRGPRSEGAARS